MATFIIPLAGVAESFGITLNGVNYGLEVIYRNDPGGEGGWFLDFYDANDNPILRGVPFVTGADLLGQYGYMGFGGSLYVLTAQDPNAPPTFTNLGTDCQLYWETPTP